MPNCSSHPPPPPWHRLSIQFPVQRRVVIFSPIQSITRLLRHDFSTFFTIFTTPQNSTNSRVLDMSGDTDYTIPFFIFHTPEPTITLIPVSDHPHLSPSLPPSPHPLLLLFFFHPLPFPMGSFYFDSHYSFVKKHRRQTWTSPKCNQRDLPPCL
jgi:hypothetical protein